MSPQPKPRIVSPALKRAARSKKPKTAQAPAAAKSPTSTPRSYLRPSCKEDQLSPLFLPVTSKSALRLHTYVLVTCPPGYFKNINDILCSRGGLSNTAPGNNLYRSLSKVSQSTRAHETRSCRTVI